MPKLLTALGTATILMASNAIIWKAEAAMVTGVGNLPLSNSYSLAKRFAASAALMDAPAAAAIGHATRAIGPIAITAMSIGPDRESILPCWATCRNNSPKPPSIPFCMPGN